MHLKSQNDTIVIEVTYRHYISSSKFYLAKCDAKFSTSMHERFIERYVLYFTRYLYFVMYSGVLYITVSISPKSICDSIVYDNFRSYLKNRILPCLGQHVNLSCQQIWILHKLIKILMVQISFLYDICL
jgi:hypothetical protein